MTLIMFLALAAFVFKVYWWYASRNYAWADARWFLLLGAFSLLNIIEFFGNDLFRTSASPMFFIQAYFAVGMFSFCTIYAFICKNQEYLYDRMLYLMLIGATAITIALFNGSAVLDGYVPDVYPLRSNKGGYFFVVYFYSFACSLAIFAKMVFQYRAEAQSLQRVEYLSLFWAFLPFLLVAAWSSGSYILGVNANTGGMIPIATSWFLATVVKVRCKDPILILRDPRRNIPASEQSNLYGFVERIVAQYAINNPDINKTMNLLERELLRYQIEEHIRVSRANSTAPSKRAFARSVGLSRPTLDRKLKKYHLDHFIQKATQRDSLTVTTQLAKKNALDQLLD